MATFLYRLGRFSFRRRRLVLMLWIAVLAAIGIGARRCCPASTSDTFTIPGTQSQKALDLLAEGVPAGRRPTAPRRAWCSRRPPGRSSPPRPTRPRSSPWSPTLKPASAGGGRRRPLHRRHRQQGRLRRLRPGDLQGRRRPTSATPPAPPWTDVAEQGETAGLDRRAWAARPSTRSPRAERGRADRRRGRRPGPGHHLRLAGRGRTAAADRAPRRRLAAICGITLATSFFDLSSQHQRPWR